MQKTLEIIEKINEIKGFCLAQKERFEASNFPCFSMLLQVFYIISTSSMDFRTAFFLASLISV